MGGRALKNIETRRVTTKELFRYSDEVISKLGNDINETHLVKFVGSKKTHGDIDIIYTMDGSKNIHEVIKNKFKPKEVFINSNCISFEYKDVQIDLIRATESNFESTCNYYDYGLGMYIGRVAQKHNLKFGHKGLLYKHYFKGQNIGELLITNDFKQILKFLGFDYGVWVRGFDTPEDIYDFIISSKYFNSNIFQLENLDSTNKHRNSKRVGYLNFLEYINNLELGDNMFIPKTIKDINNTFPESKIIENICLLEYEESKHRYIKSKFNGGIVMNRYGLKGKMLGETLSSFKSFINDDTDYNQWLFKTDSEDILNKFEDFYKYTYTKERPI